MTFKMDLQMNLFLLEDCVKSSNGYSYVQKSLNSLLEHQTFSLKDRSEIQAVISYINTKLNSNSGRSHGLYLLSVFLPQCSDDVFIDNSVSWMQLCVRICSASKDKQTVQLAYEVLGNLFQYSGMIQELTKSAAASVVPKFLEHVQHILSDFNNFTENVIALLRCMEVVIRNYGGSCSPHKSNLEKFLLKFLDHPDEQTIYLVARCIAVLPLVGGSGVQSINHKTSWEVLQKNLVSQLHEILDSLFEGIPEVQLLQCSEKSTTEKLHTPLLEESDPFVKILRLCTRFVNLTCFLKELLLHEFPVAKRVALSLFINVFIRGIAIDSNTVSKHITADKLLVGCLIPQIHVALLKLLNALIICCGQNLLEYGSLICRLVLQTLKWTSYEKHWPHGTVRPYGELRKEACNTLTMWLQVAKGGSSLEISSPDELIGLLLGEVKINQAAVTLSVTKARGRYLTKQQRKQSKQGQGSTAALPECSWSRAKLYDETANHLTCTAALRSLQWIVQAAGPFLKPTLHKLIQEVVVKVLLRIGRDDVVAPYHDSTCRLELYQLLHALVLWPHYSWPSPLQFALQLLRIGLSDSNVKVASFCYQSLNTTIKLAHPVSSPLHFTASLEGMQEVIRLENNSCHNEVFMNEDVDTDESPMDAELVNNLTVFGSPRQESDIVEKDHHDKSRTKAQPSNGASMSEKCCETLRPSLSIDSLQSKQVTLFQSSSVDGDETCKQTIDIIADNNGSLILSSETAKEGSHHEKIGSKLRTPNEHSINASLVCNDYASVQLVEDSAESEEDEAKVLISGLHSLTKIDNHEQKCITIGSDSSSEKNKFEESEQEENVDEINDEEMRTGRKVIFEHLKESTTKTTVSSKIYDSTVDKLITSKMPASSDNYSISYLYDQSSDSSDSIIEHQTVMDSSNVKNGQTPKEMLEDSSAGKLYTNKNEGQESNQYKEYNNDHESEVVGDEMQQISELQKMCRKEQDNESRLPGNNCSEIKSTPVVCVRDRNSESVLNEEIQPFSHPYETHKDNSDDTANNKDLLQNSHLDDTDKQDAGASFPKCRSLPIDCKDVMSGSEDSEVDVETISEKVTDVECKETVNSLLKEVINELNEENITCKDPDLHDKTHREPSVEDFEVTETTSLATGDEKEDIIPVTGENYKEKCSNNDAKMELVAKSNQEVKISQRNQVELIQIPSTREILLEENHTAEYSCTDVPMEEHSQVEIPQKHSSIPAKDQETIEGEVVLRSSSASMNAEETFFVVGSQPLKSEMKREHVDSTVVSDCAASEKLTEPVVKKRKIELCDFETKTTEINEQQQNETSG